MKQIEMMKRIILLQLKGVCLLFEGALYAYFYYAAYINLVQPDFYRRGHWLVIGISMMILLLFSQLYGGLKIGYSKPTDVMFSQSFATLCANVFFYFQISLLSGHLVDVIPVVKMSMIAIIGVAAWTYSSDALYRKMFPPRKLLLVHGERSIKDIMEKVATRKDKYEIKKSIMMRDLEDFDHVIQEISDCYDGLMIWDVPSNLKGKLVKYCYGKSIRVYLMPKISDVIIRGSAQLHLFDSPILLTREYSITIEQIIAKRFIDLICSLILAIVTSPIMVFAAIIIKLQDRGPVFYTQVRVTRANKEFKIIKFRSMRVDAEKDGVARLASTNDSRITPFGKFIRKVRIDELPQLFNIIKGDMSFIGPRPERPEIISQYVEDMPEFAFRTRVKAGLAGYAQVYGKYNTTPYDKLKLDLSYIENYSVWLDIKLMLLTLKILFKSESTEGIDENQKTALRQYEEEDNR